MKEIILASASPRRKMLLEQVGLDFRVITPDVDESIDECINDVPGAKDFVKKLAYEKAAKVAELQKTGVIVIGADTVVFKGSLLGKPVDREHAFSMLKSLEGGWHQVITGFCIIRTGRCGSDTCVTGHEVTRVRFRSLSDKEINRYINSEEYEGKAGAYAIQGKGAVFVDRIEGCYFNIVGLPVTRLVMELGNFGVEMV